MHQTEAVLGRRPPLFSQTLIISRGLLVPMISLREIDGDAVSLRVNVAQVDPSFLRQRFVLVSRSLSIPVNG